MENQPELSTQTVFSRIRISRDVRLGGPPSSPQPSRLKPLLWQGKIGPAFWTIAGVFSLVLNVVLIVTLVLVGKELFNLKNLVTRQLIGGLHRNFALMDQAVISTRVPVHDTIPVQFTLPVKATTHVTLSEDTVLSNARVNLVTGGLSITQAPTDILLPAGTQLPIELNLEVPVDTTVPVDLEVFVEIPLRDTQLHNPFVGLQNVISPYNELLANTPDGWQEVWCQNGDGFLCSP